MPNLQVSGLEAGIRYLSLAQSNNCCRKRKIKCDEQHPICKNCQSTHRKCNGYSPPSIYPPAPLQSPNAGSRDQELLCFFQEKTAPKFFGELSTNFWENQIAQASTVEDPVLYAVIAVAAIHRDYRKWRTGTVDPSSRAFVIMKYNGAIRRLRLVNTKLDRTLTVSFCFIALACLMRDQYVTSTFTTSEGLILICSSTSAAMHLKAGFKILGDMRLHNPTNLNNARESTFAPMLLSLGIVMGQDSFL
jgi:hypothetical protein